MLESSSGDTASGVVISDNTFERIAIAIEMAVGGKASRLTGTRITGNTITAGIPTVFGTTGGGIYLDTIARNGTIDQTLIEDNAISRGGIGLQCRSRLPGFDPAPLGDVISNTRIVNNVISPIHGIIYVEGGVEPARRPVASPGSRSRTTPSSTTSSRGPVCRAPKRARRKRQPDHRRHIINSIFYEPSAPPSM